MALTICDQEGERLFTDADVEALGEKSSTALNRVWDVARRLSALTVKDEQALLKNSKADPAAASGSGSRSRSA